MKKWTELWKSLILAKKANGTTCDFFVKKTENHTKTAVRFLIVHIFSVFFIEKEHREKISEKLKTIQEREKDTKERGGTHDKFYWLLQLHGDSDVYQSVLFHCGDVVYCERVV